MSVMYALHTYAVFIDMLMVRWDWQSCNLLNNGHLLVMSGKDNNLENLYHMADDLPSGTIEANSAATNN